MLRAAVIGMLIVCASVAQRGFAQAAQKPNSALLHQYFQQGSEALAQGRFAEAEEAFEKLTQLDPTAAVPYANLGLVYFEERKYPQAIPAFEQALKRDGGLSNAHYFLAMSLAELGHYEQALPGLEEGFRAEKDAKLKRLLGLHLEKAYTGLERNREAMEVALQLVQLYPNDAEVLYKTSRVSANFSYLSLQKLGQVAPQSVWRHLASGDFYETQGHYALAEREYRAAIALAPAMPGLHFRLGRALVRSRTPGAQAEALKEFQQELALDPTNAGADFEAAQILRKTGRLDQASALLRSALRSYPDYEDAERELGQTLMLQREPRAALSALQRAVKLDPEDSAAWYQLSLALHALGDSAEEQKALAQFHRLKARQIQQANALAASPQSPESPNPPEVQ